MAVKKRPAMVSAAEATTTLRVGCRVFCTGYHNAVVLGKQLATIDRSSQRVDHAAVVIHRLDPRGQGRVVRWRLRLHLWRQRSILVRQLAS